MTSQETPELSLEERFRAAAPLATRTIGGLLPDLPAARLRALADETESLPDPEQWDRYGERGPVQRLESKVAELLGKPAAVMFPSGIMAQQATLRVWTDRTGSDRVALPELSHLLQHEMDGPRLLHGFRFELLTRGPKVPTAEHLADVPGRLGAVLTELPLRDAGYLLPTWKELVDLADACRARDVPLHLDGARLWESQPQLGHPLAEIAGLANSVYVSFYKGLRGLAGAAVACAEDVAAELRLWRTRLGGTLFSLLPYAVAALRGLRIELPRMAEYHIRAKELAAALAERGVDTVPSVPQVNAFRVVAGGDSDDVFARVVDVLEQERLIVTSPWVPADVPGRCWTEFTVGPGTMDWTVTEAADRIAAVVNGGAAAVDRPERIDSAAHI
jgi:threonine aldolase